MNPAPGPRLWHNARIATLNDDTSWGLVENGALVVDGRQLAWVGPQAALPQALRARVVEQHDMHGALITPGLVDCHTHLIYGGQRADEFEMRLNGATYEEIARAGGGIRSTVAATRAAGDAELFAAAERRARVLMAEGVTTLEIKSGYGLSLEHEARCLALARRLGTELPLAVRTSFLGAHALPAEFSGRADDYIDAVCTWLPQLHARGLVDAVDAFCENIGFTPAQTRRVFEAAAALGVPVKLHAEQLSDSGGAILAAEFGALSCDHLEYLSEAGVRAMRAAGSIAVLLPGAYYFLRETQAPPVALLRELGVPIALGSDHNPGSSPGLSLLLMLQMACTLFRLTPLEALRAVTVNGARALGLTDRGRLRAGMHADFAVWDLQHPNELAYWFGHNPCRQVVAGGSMRPAQQALAT